MEQSNNPLNRIHSVKHGLIHLVSKSLRVFGLNVEVVRLGDSPNKLYQCRVGIVRLRAAAPDHGLLVLCVKQVKGCQDMIRIVCCQSFHVNPPSVTRYQFCFSRV